MVSYGATFVPTRGLIEEDGQCACVCVHVCECVWSVCVCVSVCVSFLLASLERIKKEKERKIFGLPLTFNLDTDDIIFS